jgi:DNA-binding beta-propeller fold protein YncE
MTFIDLDESADGESVLDCAESERRCSDARNRGTDVGDNPRGLTFPNEPVGMLSLHARDAAAGLDADQAPGDFVVVAHRNGQVSLFHDPGEDGPRLVHVLDGLPLELTGVAFEPASHLLYLSVYARNSVVTGQTRLLGRVGFTVEAGQSGGLQPSFTYDAGSIVVDGVAAQRDTRAVAVNPARPGELLVAGRDPASLLFVNTQATAAVQNSAALTNFPARDIVSVGAGPTRMALGKLGEREIVAVSCFDGHQLYLVDAVTAEVVTVVHNLNGPFELAIDAVRKRLYVADFRSSSVQVIDLGTVAAAGAGSRTDAPILATLGIPKVVQELQ